MSSQPAVKKFQLAVKGKLNNASSWYEVRDDASFKMLLQSKQAVGMYLSSSHDGSSADKAKPRTHPHTIV
jgi:hypothetical protein